MIIIFWVGQRKKKLLKSGGERYSECLKKWTDALYMIIAISSWNWNEFADDDWKCQSTSPS